MGKYYEVRGFAMSLCSATKSERLQFLKPVSSDQHLYGKQKQRPRQRKMMQVGGVGNVE